MSDDFIKLTTYKNDVVFIDKQKKPSDEFVPDEFVSDEVDEKMSKTPLIIAAVNGIITGRYSTLCEAKDTLGIAANRIVYCIVHGAPISDERPVYLDWTLEADTLKCEAYERKYLGGATK